MLRRSYTSAAAAHTHGRPRGVTRDPRRCNGHPRPLPGAARRAAPLSANACPIPLVARARLPQAACCTVQGVGHDVSPCSGLPGAALGSGGAWRGARLLPGLQYGRYLSRFADILRDSRFRGFTSCCALVRVHLVSCAAHGPPLAAHQCVTPLAIFSWIASTIGQSERALNHPFFRVGPLTQADAAVLKTTDEKVERLAWGGRAVAATVPGSFKRCPP